MTSKANMLKEFLKETYKFFGGKYDQISAPWRPYYDKTDIKKESKIIIDAELPSYFNWKSSEWAMQKCLRNGKSYLAIAICGSNDLADWALNIDLRVLPVWDSKDKKVRWFKWSGVMEARRIVKTLKKTETFNLPLLIGVHSKSGATAPPLLIMLRKAGIMVDKTCSIEPATCVTKRYKIENYTIYYDPDDIIPNLGKPILKHPLCKFVKHPGGKSGNDHSLSNWDGFLS